MPRLIGRRGRKVVREYSLFGAPLPRVVFFVSLL